MIQLSSIGTASFLVIAVTTKLRPEKLFVALNLGCTIESCGEPVKNT